MGRKKFVFKRLCQAVGVTIRQRRKSFGYTQVKLASQINITQAALSAIELGKGWSSVPTYLLIATALRMNLPELFAAAQQHDSIDKESIPPDEGTTAV